VRLFCRMSCLPDRNQYRLSRLRTIDEHSECHGDG
jgi:hypothetical protein